jgi:hypothetical protein
MPAVVVALHVVLLTALHRRLAVLERKEKKPEFNRDQ